MNADILSCSHGNGYIYVLGNKAMPGLYKIGSTRNHPKQRVIQLSAETGIPLRFDLLGYALVKDCKLEEKKAHRKFNSYRLSARREFFSCRLGDIQDHFCNIDARDFLIYVEESQPFYSREVAA